MDRAVYGYGASEFTGFERQIARIRAENGTQQNEAELDVGTGTTELAGESATDAPAAPGTEQERLLEAQKLAEEQRLAEAKRILDEEQAAEQERVANEELAAEAAQQAEEMRLVEEARANLRAQRAAEAERLAEEERLEQAKRVAKAKLEEQQLREAEQARLAEAERLAAAESLALATAKAEARIIEERARRNREADSELARQQAQAQESERIRSEEALEEATVVQPAPTPQTRTQAESVSITDDDFNFVAGKFVELKTAVTNQDIDTVIALTKPSGKRIQQMLQMFENSTSVQARVSNVATRNADGVIVGELKIQKLIKDSGAEATVPSNLSSITLSSKRGPEGWSAIAW